MIYDEFIFLNNSLPHIRFTSNFALEKISNLLQAKGMDPEVAIERAQRVFGEESHKATLYLHNLQHLFDAEGIKKVYDFIMHKALFEEPVYFDSYDHMLGMMQKVHRSSLSEEELGKIRQISQANRFGVALIR